MLSILARVSVVIVALLHLGFMVLETTQWARPLGRKLTHLSEGAARETAGVGVDMGLYNGFIGLALLWVSFALGLREAYSSQWLLLSFIVIAGIVGAVTIRNSGIFLFQSLPALFALLLIWVDRPYPRTENEAIREITRIERQILALKSVDARPSPTSAEGSVPRAQHPKLHGIVNARFIVANDLPDELRVGVFKEPGKVYDSWVRFSNARNQDDQERGGHGMAVKLQNVPAGNGSRSSQDFVLFDAPAFFVGNPIQYVEFEEATLRAYGKSKLETLATTFLGYYWKHPHQFLNLLKTQRGDVTDPLAIRYYSVTPYRLGTVPVKYSAQPAANNGAAVLVPRSRDMLREAMKAHLGERDAEFEFRVQTQSDPASMPVEDPTVEWSEIASPPRTVARIVIPARQQFATPERDLFAERLSFTPWHALPEHEPLGGINRTRQSVYESLSEFRHALNHAPRQEPTEPSPSD